MLSIILQIIFSIIFFWLLTNKNLSLMIVVFTGLFIRWISTLSGIFLINLPEDAGDAKRFQLNAINKSEYSLYELLTDWEISSNLYSDFIAIIYKLSNYSKVGLYLLSILAGTYIIILTYKISLLIWKNEKISIFNSFLVAFYPTLILYSSLTLRESIITLLLCIIFKTFINFINKFNFLNFFYIILLNFLLSILHGGHFIIYLSLMIFFIGYLFNKKTNTKIYSVLIISVLSIIFIFILGNFDSLPKLKYFYSLDTYSIFIKLNNIKYLNSEASYSDFLIIENVYELFLNIIPRIIYFFYSPFIWEVSNYRHLFGVLDGLFFLVICILGFSFKLLKNKYFIYFLIIYGPLLLLFALSTFNFGTAIRHRSKYIPFIIIFFVGNFLINFYEKKQK